MAEPNFEQFELHAREAQRCVDRAFGEVIPSRGVTGEAGNYLLEAKASLDRALTALGVEGYAPNEAATSGE